MTISPVIEARSDSLPLDLGRREAGHALLQNEAADLAVMGLGLRPDHEDIGDRAVGDPHLRAGQA
jgi:hypothetical protein